MSWASLRSDYPALSPAQLNHLLSLYSPAPPCRHVWTPPVHEQASAYSTGQSFVPPPKIQPHSSSWRTDFPSTVDPPPSADTLESFETQHPLVLPDAGYQFQLGKDLTDSALWEKLDDLNKFISTQKQKVPTSNVGIKEYKTSDSRPLEKGFFTVSCPNLSIMFYI